MKRILASLLLVAQVALVAGPAVAQHHDDAAGHECCHEVAAPADAATVEGPEECAHCSLADCAAAASCAGTTTPLVSHAALAFVEEFAPAGQTDPVTHRVFVSTRPVSPPPKA